MEYTGKLITGDFEDNTMTFEIEGDMILKAGKYKIVRIKEGDVREDELFTFDDIKCMVDAISETHIPDTQIKSLLK